MLFCFIDFILKYSILNNSIIVLFSHPRSYELPPPSRSRDNTLNIFDPSYNDVSDNPHITSHQPVTPSPVLVNFSNQFGYRLVPVYIPGEGYRYLIAVPSEKWNHLNTNHISDHQQQKYDKYEKYDKYNGRYNAKLKKYKAYEKFLKPQQQLKQQVMASGGCKSYLLYACKFFIIDVYTTAVWHPMHALKRFARKLEGDAKGCRRCCYASQSKLRLCQCSIISN